MKYAQMWEELKLRLKQEAFASGEMMSLAEWVHTTANAERYLALMDKLEEKHE